MIVSMFFAVHWFIVFLTTIRLSSGKRKSCTCCWGTGKPTSLWGGKFCFPSIVHVYCLKIGSRRGSVATRPSGSHHKQIGGPPKWEHLGL